MINKGSMANRARITATANPIAIKPLAVRLRYKGYFHT